MGEAGVYGKMALVPEQANITQGICLFPIGGPELTRCVTKGEGVIGLFPILTEGGWVLNSESDPHGQYQSDPHLQVTTRVPGVFRYQSASGRMASMRGSFGGVITFVPGTIKQPTGPPFDVTVKKFGLRIPKYI